MKRLAVADPHASFAASRAQLIEAFARVLDSGRYILGERVTEFERVWATRCGSEHAIGVSSGTDALALALRAAGVGAGDEVLVPAMTAMATWMAVSQIGARPVGVDIELARNGIDPADAAAAVTPRTKALVVVHLFGQPADLTALQSFASSAGLVMIEDAAQAHGASLGGRSVGSFGALATFSFYPTKNLGALGDAGAVTTSEGSLAERVRMLREYGWRTREDAVFEGFNARLDELQAAFLLTMLTGLDAALARRRELARCYLDGLAGVSELELPPSRTDSESAWHLFVVRHPRREALAAALRELGIETAVHYATLPPHNRAFVKHTPAGAFPRAERHAANALSLPLHPGLSDDDAQRVIEAVRGAAPRV